MIVVILVEIFKTNKTNGFCTGNLYDTLSSCKLLKTTYIEINIIRINYHVLYLSLKSLIPLHLNTEQLIVLFTD